MGMTGDNAARWRLLRGMVFREYQAAGCCPEWLLRVAEEADSARLFGLLCSAPGMLFGAERGVPSLGLARAAAEVIDLARYGIYVDGEGSEFGRWRRGGGMVFIGPARSEVRPVAARAYRVLALHGAEVDLLAGPGARVQVLAGAGARVAVLGLGEGADALRWDRAAGRWRPAREGDVVEG